MSMEMVHGVVTMATVAALLCTFNFATLDVKRKSRLMMARMGFVDPRRLYAMAKAKTVEGFEMPHKLEDEDFVGQVQANPVKRPHKTRTKDKKEFDPGEAEPWQGAAVDGFGPFQCPTVHNAVGAFIFTCLRTADRIVKLYKARSDYPAILRQVCDELAVKGWRLKYVFSDGAPELIGEQAQIVEAEYGLVLECSSPYTAQENSKAESSNRVLSRIARAIFLNARPIPDMLYGLALKHAAKIDRLMPRKELGGKCAQEVVEGKRVSWRKLNMHVWGCPCFYGLTLPQRMALGGNLKASPKAMPGRYVGYEGATIYVYVPDDAKVRKISYTKVWFFEAEYAEKTDMTDVLTAADAEETVSMVQSDQTQKPRQMITMEEEPAEDNVEGVLDKSKEPSAKKTKKLASDAEVTAKVEAYRGVQFSTTEDSSKGEVISAKLAKAKGATRRQWHLQIKWEPGGETLWCPEKDAIKYVGERAEELDQGDTVGEEEEEETRTVTRRRSSRISAAATLLVSVFAVMNSAFDAANSKTSFDGYEVPVLDYESMKRRKPKTVTHALMDDDWFLWYRACQSEHDGWIDGQVVQPIKKSERIEGCKTIHSRVVLERKWDKKSGAFVKNKVRCAVRGDQLRPGIDYRETFSPTAGAAAIRLVLLVASTLGRKCRKHKFFKLRQADVKQAYLNAQASQVYYIHVPSYAKYAEMDLGQITRERSRLKSLRKRDPKQFEREARQVSDMSSDYVWLARSSCYGGPSAGREWNTMFVGILIDQLGFKQSTYEPCLFWIGEIGGPNEWILLVIWVDDCLYVGTDTKVDWFVAEFQKHATFGEEGEASAFVGLAIDHSKETGETKLSCPVLIDKLVRNMGEYLKGRYNRRTPARASRTYVKATDEEFEEAKHLPLPNIVGACLFASNWCRPDITSAVAMLSCHMTKWSKDHFDGALDLVMYLRATRSEGIMFGRADEPQDLLVAWADSDLGADPATRRPRTGWVIKCGGGPLDWMSSLQKTNMDDVTSCEIKAAAKGAKKTRIIYNVMSEIGGQLRPRMAPILFGDNAAAVQVNNNLGALGNRVRHLELSHFMTRDLVLSAMLFYLWCSTDKMRADMFTKALGRVAFERNRTAVVGYEYKPDTTWEDQARPKRRRSGEGAPGERTPEQGEK